MKLAFVIDGAGDAMAINEETYMKIDQSRLEQLDTLVIGHGSHTSFEEGHCAMEVVAYISGETHSDHPACACPVITRFMIGWNDRISGDARRTEVIRPLIPLVIGTRSTKAIEEARVWRLTDWGIRTQTPALLRLAGLTEQADVLAALDPIASYEDLVAARATLLTVRDAARARRYLRWDALRERIAQGAAEAAVAEAAAVAAVAVEVVVAAEAEAVVVAAEAAVAAEAVAAEAAVAVAVQPYSDEDFAAIEAEYAEYAGYTAALAKARRLVSPAFAAEVRRRLPGFADLTLAAQDLVRELCTMGRAA